MCKSSQMVSKRPASSSPGGSSFEDQPQNKRPRLLTTTVSGFPMPPEFIPTTACMRCIAMGEPDGCSFANDNNGAANESDAGLRDECTRCRNDRFTPDSGTYDHGCLARDPNNSAIVVYRLRSRVQDEETNFQKSDLETCWECLQHGYGGCDADRQLSIKCTACDVANRSCRVGSSDALFVRPYDLAGDIGLRVACSTCRDSDLPCSWLDKGWSSTVICDHCKDTGNISCQLDTVKPVGWKPKEWAMCPAPPQPLEDLLGISDQDIDPALISSTARVPVTTPGTIPAPVKEPRPWQQQRPNRPGKRFELNDFPAGQPATEMRANGRLACYFCYLMARPCSVSTKTASKSCIACSKLGIKCVDRDTMIIYPDWNTLATAGRTLASNDMQLENFRCGECSAAEHPCDHKRPCEVCVHKGHPEKCDQPDRGQGTWPADRVYGDRSGNYYMAMGYGATGIGTERRLDELAPGRLLVGPDGYLEVRLKRESDKEMAETMQERLGNLEKMLEDLYKDEYKPPGEGWFPPCLVPANANEVNDPPGHLAKPDEKRAWMRGITARQLGPEFLNDGGVGLKLTAAVPDSPAATPWPQQDVAPPTGPISREDEAAPAAQPNTAAVMATPIGLGPDLLVVGGAATQEQPLGYGSQAFDNGSQAARNGGLQVNVLDEVQTGQVYGLENGAADHTFTFGPDHALTATPGDLTQYDDINPMEITGNEAMIGHPVEDWAIFHSDYYSQQYHGTEGQNVLDPAAANGAAATTQTNDGENNDQQNGTNELVDDEMFLSWMAELGDH